MARVLVVDDEQQIVSIIEKFLTKNGYEVVSVNEGEKALELIRSGESIDLAVLDIKMPNISGLDILRQICTSAKNIPVIILSGSIGTQDNVDELRELGYDENDILYKPIDLNDLLGAIKSKLTRD